MVFESLVVDLMNKYLGKYVENLDPSQLSIGTWGGDVVLENLHIKGDALKELDLPLQIKSGFVGKLTLQIPWKNLYKAPVIATLNGLYLLAMPNDATAYDPKKEDAAAEADKQAQLQSIEDQLLKKNETKSAEKEDGFVEKLAMQIIKNLQVDIRNIHIRYEDETSIKNNPFAIGVTLSQLSLQTTNENWLPCILDESYKIIYKLVSMKSLAVYFNSNPKLYCHCPREEQLNLFKVAISSEERTPEGLTYVIRPISLESKLRLNPNPLSDLENPKVILSVILNEIGLSLSHNQYHSIMQLVESMDRLSLNAPFRKFKPNVQLTGNAKIWWKYAYNSIVQAEVKRKLSLSWSHIKAHRDKLKEYKKMYKEKLVQKKPPDDLVAKLIKLENNLDIFNITLTRQLAETELVKKGEKIRSKKSLYQKEESSGWLGGWFGGRKKKEKDQEDKKKKEIMSDVEKKHLYAAINYSEGQTFVDQNFPKTYVEKQINLNLEKVSVHLIDDRKSLGTTLINLEANNITTKVAQRPSANAVSVELQMREFFIDGLQQESITPHLVTSKFDESSGIIFSSLLKVNFETNPLDESCDQKVSLHSKPLQITYDACTINTLVDFIKPPQNLQFQQLKTVAASTYDDVKQQTATGLKHAMESRKVTNVDINLMSSFVVIPQSGLYTEGCAALVVDLGKVMLSSINDGSEKSLNLAIARTQAYDKFQIDIKNIQILLAKQNADWMTGRTLVSSHMHILEPLNISIFLQKCIVANDAALPKLKVSGELPLLSVRITDEKLKNALALVESIPLPEPSKEEKNVTYEYIATKQIVKASDIDIVAAAFEDDYGSSPSVSSAGVTSSAEEDFYTADSEFSDVEDHLFSRMKRKKIQKRIASGTRQLTEVMASFVIDKVFLTIGESQEKRDVDILSLTIENFGTQACVKTFDTTVNAFLGSIYLQYLPMLSFDDKPIHIIKTPLNMEKKLLTIDITMAKKTCPDFAEVYHNIEQNIKVKFCALEVTVHSKALLEIKTFMANLIPEKKEVDAKEVQSVVSSVGESDSFVTARGSNSSASSTDAKYNIVASSKDITNVNIVAKLDSFIVNMVDESSQIASVAVQGIAANIKVTPKLTSISAKLENFLVIDHYKDTLYQEIITAVGGNVLIADILVYNGNTEGDNYKDMSLVDTSVKVKLGSMRVVFIKRFVDALITFSANFQDAKAIAAEAGSKAQEAAMASAKKLAARNPRISLDVMVTVPSIMIPSNSNSLNVLKADLGNVKIKNVFEIVGAEDTKIPAVSDNMSIDIMDVKVALCEITASKVVLSEYQLLEPMSLQITLKRNLAAAWFHDVSDISINGKLQSVSIKVSAADISSVLKILDENIKESPPPQEEKVSVKHVATEEAIKEDGTAISSAVSVTSTLKEEILSTPTKEVWETLNLNFVIDSVKVHLFKDKEREFPLSKFYIETIGMEIEQRSDTSQDISVSLGDILLEDLRVSHKDRLTRYIERKSTAHSGHIVNATIKKLADGSMNIKSYVSSLSIIICVEFLVKIGEELGKAFAKPQSKEEEEIPGNSEDYKKADKKVEPINLEVEQEEIKTSIHVEFILYRPDIILVTDLKSEKAESIVLGLKLELIFNTSSESSEKRLACRLTDLQINSCPFEEIQNLALDDAVEHKKVLTPCDIDVNATLADVKQEFFINVSKIRIIASPIVINTISEAAAMLTLSSPSDIQISALVLKKPKPETRFSLKNKKFWFIDQAQEILNANKEDSSTDLLSRASILHNINATDKKLSETMSLKVPDIRVQLEAGEGHHSVPLLITQLGVNADISDWSGGEMKACAILQLGVVYFNEALSVWEPLLEPVETNPGHSSSKYKLWELKADVKQNKASESGNIEELPALMEITVSSQNILHTTVTHSALKALKGLGKAFSDAAMAKNQNSPSPSKKRQGHENISAGVKIRNVLGRELNVTIGKGLTVLAGANRMSDQEYLLKDGTTLYADFTKTEFSDIWVLLENQTKASTALNNLVQVRLPGQQDYGVFDISKTGYSYHSLSDGKRNISIICYVESKGGVRTVVLQSCVILYNHLLDRIQLINDANAVIGVIEPEEHYPIPYSLVEESTKLFLKPIGELIKVGKSQVAIEKREFKQLLRFAPAVGDATPININVETTIKEVISTQGMGNASGILTMVTCKPNVVLKNFLPFPVEYNTFGVGFKKVLKTLLPGNSVQIYDAELSKSRLQVQLKDYRGSDWLGSVAVQTEYEELSEWKFENTKEKGNFMILGKQVTYSEGFMIFTLYSPYWMINETEQMLEYKGSDNNKIVHPPEKQDFILFAYNSKSFLSKNSLQLRVNKSDYSSKFSIDAVGSSGTMICQAKNFDYMIGTNIKLTSYALTKIVTFTNYFTLKNTSSFDLEVCEQSMENFVNLFKGKKIKFWPETKDACLKVRTKDNPKSLSLSFNFRKLDSGVLLRVGEEMLFVDVTVTEYSVTVSFKDYYPGASAVLVVNHTKDSRMVITQNKDRDAKTSLGSLEAMHYVWPAPSKKRLLTWQIDNNKENTVDIFQESAGTMKITEKSSVYWCLFIDGMQRVLVITEDKAISEVAQQGLNTERSNMEINISLQGFSLSIADTKLRREVMYCAITSSGIIWEEKPKRRFQALPLKYAGALETAYQKMNTSTKLSSSAHIVKLDKFEFDINNMKALSPNKGDIRRYFSPGIWAQYSMSNHQTLLHLKMNKIQVDNQLSAAVFPVVLNPIPLPKTLAVDNSPKPFLEFSLMTRKSEHQSFTHVKYFKVLIQEFSVKLDMGFISALLPVFGADQVKITNEKEIAYFTNDVTNAIKRDDVEEITQDSDITFYDNLHLSPIKLHVSFSMQNNCYDDGQTASVVELPFNAFTAILKSVGVTLSDIDDVVFKLGYFERFYQFFSTQQFSGSVSMHYAGQAIKQMYVLVLGLDVIGNPYGLVMGIAEGVTDMFYEPYQGMIQGPGEFVEGLALGARSLLGHTVGGAAGAVSRVTGALGKGLATMTMDDEYKKKRQMEKNKQPADLKEGLARGGKGLVMGVVGGLTGVVTKPMEGAQKEGAAGFFKGVGKGLVGIVARPASGVIDLASNTFEGIQSLADMSVEVKRMRPARSFDSKSGILQPYSLKGAQGNAILMEVEKGSYADSVMYKNHVPLDKNKKSFLIVTDKMILEAHTGEIFGQWNSAWKYDYTEIIEEPHMAADGGIKIVTPKQRHKLFGRSSNGMTITFYDSAYAKQVLDMIRKDWSATPKLQRSESLKKEKRGLGLSFKKKH